MGVGRTKSHGLRDDSDAEIQDWCKAACKLGMVGKLTVVYSYTNVPQNYQVHAPYKTVRFLYGAATV